MNGWNQHLVVHHVVLAESDKDVENVIRQTHFACIFLIIFYIKIFQIYFRGDDSETEVCNRKPCKGECTRKRIEDSECTGFLSLLKGVRCKTFVILLLK